MAEGKKQNLKYCECGCGQIVKQRFVHGHNKAHLGKKHSEETRLKMSLVHKGQIPWHKGKTNVYSPEVLESNRVKHLGKKHSEETKKKMSKNHKGLIFTKQHCENISLGKMNPSEETRIKISLGNKGKIISQETRKILSKKNKGKKLTEETKRRISQASKQHWENPEYARKVLTYVSPNKPETAILNLLNKLYPNEWKFVGDGQVIINGKNPDFINCNGQKKIIELFGDHWHRGHNPKDREKIFKPFGYKTLVIWEKELKNIKRVESKIIRFHER